MIWARMLAYVTGTVNQELLLRNEYLTAENRILKTKVKGRLILSEGEKATLAEIAHRLGRKALEVVASTAQPDTILGWLSLAKTLSTSKTVRIYLRYKVKNPCSTTNRARNANPRFCRNLFVDRACAHI
jgi:hypothetical protein